MFSDKIWKKNSKQAIAGVCHRLYENGYLVATSGNVSVRHESGFYITPASTRKDCVRPKDIVLCDDNGRTLEPSKKPSSEAAMHREVYRQRPDVAAAIHAHPHYSIACSLSGISLSKIILPELAIYIGPVPIVPYATPGTEELPEALIPYLPDHNAFLLSRHGVLVLGKDLEDAFNRLEHLEQIARVAYLVKSMGGIEPMSKHEVKKIAERARSLGEQITGALRRIME
ncbi:MAG TPA: class II aldolase/adducin family protein [bacterium]|jgi:L-fuculose-phosphate aldolase|nr:class II aldolase/adducin family protein [Myxococcales bacterium]OQA59178.1 MAG: L-fuculose phosphate aldolase [bacterium ADurb.Bin270]HPW45413.1 class II aldolase/adducin family protein [bacterium]HQG13254.1 class II aldolase/adducin family protein [bacterium]HQH81102.1 class II aldolase/adducin family protein [bacterium]